MATNDFWYFSRLVDTSGDGHIDGDEASDEAVDKAAEKFETNLNNYAIVAALLLTMVFDLPFSSVFADPMRNLLFLLLGNTVMVTLFVLTYFKHTDGMERLIFIREYHKESLITNNHMMATTMAALLPVLWIIDTIFVISFDRADPPPPEDAVPDYAKRIIELFMLIVFTAMIIIGYYRAKAMRDLAVREMTGIEPFTVKTRFGPKSLTLTVPVERPKKKDDDDDVEKGGGGNAPLMAIQKTNEATHQQQMHPDSFHHLMQQKPPQELQQQQYQIGLSHPPTVPPLQMNPSGLRTAEEAYRGASDRDRDREGLSYSYRGGRGMPERETEREREREQQRPFPSPLPATAAAGGGRLITTSGFSSTSSFSPSASQRDRERQRDWENTARRERPLPSPGDYSNRDKPYRRNENRWGEEGKEPGYGYRDQRFRDGRDEADAYSRSHAYSQQPYGQGRMRELGREPYPSEV
uniref:Uncharacterized protein n=1 Tax=Chromera velia CCMP2878 TaxID=1169474 RepID=A0A0G4EZJ9_9ALVE|eukprot:Cvel_14324.t1-p1 / transcript=Cvel_14324.t1 / gene=Cvel_14324 / organism=Chromera_velia_CCMP2878 / gene_product=hypothetical protein / transcript_product=hypothetical protein / location=Cvel_scaffold1014:2467-4015(-) / protein_length=465 / sequence_SO=supercontig / SO=protein_coding / is_pseudo=false